VTKMPRMLASLSNMFWQGGGCISSKLDSCLLYMSIICSCQHELISENVLSDLRFSFAKFLPGGGVLNGQAADAFPCDLMFASRVEGTKRCIAIRK